MGDAQLFANNLNNYFTGTGQLYVFPNVTDVYMWIHLQVYKIICV